MPVGFWHCLRGPGQGGGAVDQIETKEYTETIERDFRLDFFRGIGLWMIFLDHIPDDAVASWITLQNYGFSDASEFFVFISGYLAGFIYGPFARGGFFLSAAKRLWTRACHMYAAQILVLLLFVVQVAHRTRIADNPAFENEFNVFNFLQHPDVLIGQAIILRYKPVDLDVLPLFIVLVLASPLMVWCLVRRPNLTLLASAIFFVLARWFDWNMASYPPGTTWYFNPYCWQLLYFFGMWCGVGGSSQIAWILKSRWALVLAVTWILFAFSIVMTWHFHSLEAYIPHWMMKAIYPIDKTDLDMLRLTHFLALAIVVLRIVPRRWPPLFYRSTRPVILCGEHSLPIFCLGALLSFSAHWILTQYNDALWVQFAVNAAGIAIMVAAAWVLQWIENIPDLFVEISRSDCEAGR
jgi:hypothetical protein